MKIDAYTFGRITIGGVSYTNDIIVFHNSVSPNWWRKEGHSLFPEDLEEVVKRGVRKLIIGCGASSVMRVPEATLAWLREKGITPVALDTASAVEEYNKCAEDPEAAACLHLTC